MVIIEGGYFYGFHYPKKKGHGKEGIQALYNINLASAKVIQLYHDMHLGGEIGIILNLTPAYPRSQDPKDLEASRFTEAMFNNSFLDPAIKGTFPQLLVDTLKKDGVLWESTEEELDIISGLLRRELLPSKKSQGAGRKSVQGLDARLVFRRMAMARMSYESLSWLGDLSKSHL